MNAWYQLLLNSTTSTSVFFFFNTMHVGKLFLRNLYVFLYMIE